MLGSAYGFGTCARCSNSADRTPSAPHRAFFTAKRRKLLAAIERPPPNSDPTAMTRSAHTLKGSAATLAARLLARRCANLEALWQGRRSHRNGLLSAPCEKYSSSSYQALAAGPVPPPGGNAWRAGPRSRRLPCQSLAAPDEARLGRKGACSNLRPDAVFGRPRGDRSLLKTLSVVACPACGQSARPAPSPMPCATGPQSPGAAANYARVRLALLCGRSRRCHSPRPR